MISLFFLCVVLLAVWQFEDISYIRKMLNFFFTFQLQSMYNIMLVLGKLEIVFNVLLKNIYYWSFSSLCPDI